MWSSGQIPIKLMARSMPSLRKSSFSAGVQRKNSVMAVGLAQLDVVYSAHMAVHVGELAVKHLLGEQDVALVEVVRRQCSAW